MSTQAQFDATKELARLDERSAELTQQYSLGEPAKPTSKKKPKKKKQ